MSRKTLSWSTLARALLVAVPMASLSCGGNTASVTPPPASLSMAFITDAQGRAVIFHGMNVMSASRQAADRLPPIGAADAARIAGWGMNFVRYLVFWDAIEPTAGSYDDGYLAKVRAELDLFQAQGISVLIDVHQDLYAQKFDGDGAPAWAVQDDGKPFAQQSTPWQSYAQPAVVAAFDNYWSYQGAHQTLQDRYVAMLGHLAAKLGDHPAIVGWDVMNEPYPGSLFDANELASLQDETEAGPLYGFDQGPFAAFYARAIAAIRAVDADHWIVVEPRYGAPANGSRSFLPLLSDPRVGERRIVEAPHLDSYRVDTTNAYAADDDTVSRWETRRRQEISRTGDALLLGQFAVDDAMPGGDQYLQDVLDMADRNAIGWSYWSYDPGTGGAAPWNAQTGKDNPNVGWLVRPYARKVAGSPVSMKWDKSTRTFELVFTDRDGVTGNHEIWVPIALYPTGFYIVYTDPPGSTSQSFSDTTSVLTVTTPIAGGQHSITITPK